MLFGWDITQLGIQGAAVLALLGLAAQAALSIRSKWRVQRMADEHMKLLAAIATAQALRDVELKATVQAAQDAAAVAVTKADVAAVKVRSAESTMAEISGKLDGLLTQFDAAAVRMTQSGTRARRRRPK